MIMLVTMVRCWRSRTPQRVPIAHHSRILARRKRAVQRVRSASGRVEYMYMYRWAGLSGAHDANEVA